MATVSAAMGSWPTEKQGRHEGPNLPGSFLSWDTAAPWLVKNCQHTSPHPSSTSRLKDKQTHQVPVVGMGPGVSQSYGPVWSVLGKDAPSEHTDRCKRVLTHVPGSPKSFLRHLLLGKGLGADHSPRQSYLLSQKFSTNGAFVDDFTLKTGREVNLKLSKHLETNDSPNLITAHICTPARSDSDLLHPSLSLSWSLTRN